jgi:hypothetical protein
MHGIRRIALLALLISCSTLYAESNQPTQSSSNPVFEPVNCDGAPEQAILKITPPANPYALIFCSPRGHTVAPVDGYLWFPYKRPGQPFFFHAALRETNDGIHAAYFVKQAARRLEGEALRKTNKMLEVGYQIFESFDEVTQLDIASNAGLLYNIFFYTENNRPKYILGCVNRCTTSALLQQYSLEEAKSLLNK